VIKEVVQAVLALAFGGAIIMATFKGIMPPEILASLAGGSVAYFMAERKNGEERKHQEFMQTLFAEERKRVTSKAGEPD